MKKYIEILEDIKKTRASITDTAKTEKELNRIAIKTAYENGDANALEDAKAKYNDAEQRYIKETEKNTDAKIRLEILKDNAKQAYFSENINIICDIWNKYAGKPHGEKTSEKIREELRTATGFYISIGNEYDNAYITIFAGYCNEKNAPFNKLEFYPTWSGEKYPALNAENKIMELHPERFRVYSCGNYVDNVSAHAKALKKAHQAARDAEAKFAAAVSAYNNLTRGDIVHAYTHDGVKTWII